MKVLLLGGTGAIDAHLAKLLEHKAGDVTVTSRRNRPSAGRIRYIKGYAKDSAFLETFCKLHGNHDQVRYDRAYNRVFDNSAISRYINTSRFVLPDAGLQQCIRAFLEKPTFDSINWIAEARKDKLTGERAYTKEFRSIKQATKYLMYRYFKN